MTTVDFEKQLKNFWGLLKQEKVFLIKDQSEKIPDLVQRKAEYVPVFENFSGELTEKMQVLLSQIQRQQQENLLLTEQAIAYQEMLLGAVAETVKTVATKTYAAPQEKQNLIRSAELFDRKV